MRRGAPMLVMTVPSWCPFRRLGGAVKFPDFPTHALLGAEVRHPNASRAFVKVGGVHDDRRIQTIY